MLDLFINTFIVLFVVIDPIGVAPMFIALTHGGREEYKRKMAIKGTLIAAVILILFVGAGNSLLHVLGISLAAFRIAGGALLFLLAIDMLFARHSGLRSTTLREQQEAEHKNDISVFPLAIPLIAGPGALTTVLLMLTNGREQPFIMVIVLGVLILVLLITLVTLLFAVHILRFIGETGANVISRVLGIILTALAVQFVLDGVRTQFFQG